MIVKLPFLSLMRTRTAFRALQRIAAAEERSALALERLADRYAPLPALPPSDQELRTATGNSFARDAELARIEEFVERCWKDVKRAPTEEEIVRYLDGEELRL